MMKSSASSNTTRLRTSNNGVAPVKNAASVNPRKALLNRRLKVAVSSGNARQLQRLRQRDSFCTSPFYFVHLFHPPKIVVRKWAKKQPQLDTEWQVARLQ